MIIVRLMGGLGNQLFQYAAARRLALERGAKLVLDLGWFEYEAAHYATPRSYELRRLELPAGVISLPPATVARLEKGLAARVGRWPARRIRVPVLRQDPRSADIDPRILDAPATVLLVGYWQGERYFADRTETIRAEIKFADQSDAWQEMLEAIRSATSVAVHVRRGDYVTVERTNDVHGALPVEYYREAIDLVCERVEASRVFVFSDDPQWAADHLSLPLPTTDVSVTGWTAADELGLMTACRHHVIANSSFSWWGAWLAEHPEQVVVAPKAWFRDPTLNRNEIVPSRWLRI